MEFKARGATKPDVGMQFQETAAAAAATVCLRTIYCITMIEYNLWLVVILSISTLILLSSVFDISEVTSTLWGAGEGGAIHRNNLGSREK